MLKVFVVATNELMMAVRTKAFIISLLLTPLLMAGLYFFQKMSSRQEDRTPRRFAVIDRDGSLFAPLAESARARNQALATGATPTGPRFEPIAAPVRGTDAGALDELRVELSAQVRARRLHAFVELPQLSEAAGPPVERIFFYTEHSNETDLPRFIADSLRDALRARRIRDAGLTPALVDRLTPKVRTETLGLVRKDARGRVEPAIKTNPVAAVGVPLGMMMMLLFVVVVSTAPQQLNSVMEEKLSRVSEVLLGSVSALELMVGKLLGSLAVALFLAGLYVGAALVGLDRMGYGSLVPTSLLLWFLVLLVLAVVMYSALCMAVGAACSELKDAQGMMMPVMLLLTLPMLAMSQMLRAPTGSLVQGLSLFPFSAPMVMTMRLAGSPAPPAWQVALSVGLCLAATAGSVFAAGRIFRAGILMQGKSAGWAQMIRWVMRSAQ